MPRPVSQIFGALLVVSCAKGHGTLTSRAPQEAPSEDARPESEGGSGESPSGDPQTVPVPPKAPAAKVELEPNAASVQSELVGKRCISCHVQATHANRHVDLSDVTKGGSWMRPGCPNQSLLLSVLKEGKMPPPPAARLQPSDVAIVARWIEDMVLPEDRRCEDSDEPGADDGGAEPGEPGSDDGEDDEPGD